MRQSPPRFFGWFAAFHRDERTEMPLAAVAAAIAGLKRSSYTRSLTMRRSVGVGSTRSRGKFHSRIDGMVKAMRGPVVGFRAPTISHSGFCLTG
jgi:hypothetical protein